MHRSFLDAKLVWSLHFLFSLRGIPFGSDATQVQLSQFLPNVRGQGFAKLASRSCSLSLFEPILFPVSLAYRFRPIVFYWHVKSLPPWLDQIRDGVDNQREWLPVADGSRMGIRVSGEFDDALAHGEHSGHVE